MAAIGRTCDCDDDAALGWLVAQTAGECLELFGVGGVLDSPVGSSANFSRQLSTFVCCGVQPGLRGACQAQWLENQARRSLFAEAVVVPMAAGIIWGIPLVAGSLGGFGWSLAGFYAAGCAPFQSFQPGGTVGQCAGGVWNGGIGKLPREFTAAFGWRRFRFGSITLRGFS